ETPIEPAEPAEPAEPVAPAEPSGVPGREKASTPEEDTSPAPAYDTAAAPAVEAGSGAAGGSTARLGDRWAAAAEGSPVAVHRAPTHGERRDTSGSDGSELPFRTPPGQAQRGVIVPPTGSAGEEHRLPIFESVESDWFRRGKHGASRAGQINNVASGSWSSPADEGWQAAEAADVPAP